MINNSSINKFFIKHEACSEAMEWMEKDKITTEAQVWAKCNRGDWMIWTLRKAGKMDKPTSVRIAIECAKHVLKIFEKKYPKDKRPRKAIEAASAWLENPSEKTRAAYAAAYAAADDAAADAAAYAAAADAAAYAAAADAAAYAAADDAAAAYAAADAAAYAAATYAAYAAAADAAAYAAVDARSKERKWQANMLRQVLGNPFKKGTPHDK